MHPLDPDNSPQVFWERLYAKMTQPSNGRPSAALVRFAEGRLPGTALDLGCGRGDDAVWLAEQGWQVVGADISASALRAARASAHAADVADRVRFELHDLDETRPEGLFDLVTMMFVHSPTRFDRLGALRRAAGAVAPGGLLLVAGHGARPPWSSADPQTTYPTAREELETLALPEADWREVFVDNVEREGTGPNGQRGQVIDTIIAIERAGPV